MNPEKSDRSTPSTNNQQPSVDSKRNLLLQAAADCASALLSDDDFERGVNRALAILASDRPKIHSLSLLCHSPNLSSNKSRKLSRQKK